jgi:hypothetical protein
MLPFPVAPSHCVRNRLRAFGLLLLGVAMTGGCGIKAGGLQPIVVGFDDAGVDAEESDASEPVVDASPSEMRRDGAPVDLGLPRRDGPVSSPDRPPGVDAAVDRAPPRPPDAAPPPPDLAPPSPDLAGTRLLLLVGDPSPGAADVLLERRLDGLGLTVRVLPVRTAAEAMAAVAAAAGQQLIVLSSSMPEGPGLPALVRDLAIPVVCLKAAFLDSLGIGTAAFGAVSDAAIDILAPRHPLAAGQSGRVPITAERTRIAWGQPIPGATVIATFPNDVVLVSIFAVERGTATTAGSAPARRVAWLFDEPTIVALNANGWAMFDAAIRWATAAP